MEKNGILKIKQFHGVIFFNGFFWMKFCRNV